MSLSLLRTLNFSSFLFFYFTLLFIYLFHHGVLLLQNVVRTMIFKDTVVNYQNEKKLQHYIY